MFIRDKYSFYVTNVNSLTCKLVYYTIYSAGPISSWTLVVISVDRLLTLAWPLRLPCLARTRFQLLVLSIVFLYNMTLYSYLLVDARFTDPSTTTTVIKSTTTTKNVTIEDIDDDANYSTTVSYCDIGNERRLYWIDLINSSLLPFISMMITSTLTIVFIVRSRRRLSTSAISSSASRNGLASGGGGGHTVSTRLPHLAGISSKRAIRDRKFAITSVSLNVLFLILNVPAPFFGVVSTQVDIVDTSLNNFVGYLSLCCYYSYYAISFYVQLAVNSIVRERFVRFFKPGSSRVKIIKKMPTARASSMASFKPAFRFRSLQVKR